jgi:hypothetical protein
VVCTSNTLLSVENALPTSIEVSSSIIHFSRIRFIWIRWMTGSRYWEVSNMRGTFILLHLCRRLYCLSRTPCSLSDSGLDIRKGRMSLRRGHGGVKLVRIRLNDALRGTDFAYLSIISRKSVYDWRANQNIQQSLCEYHIAETKLPPLWKTPQTSQPVQPPPRTPYMPKKSQSAKQPVVDQTSTPTPAPEPKWPVISAKSDLVCRTVEPDQIIVIDVRI